MSSDGPYDDRRRGCDSVRNAPAASVDNNRWRPPRNELFVKRGAGLALVEQLGIDNGKTRRLA
jgi:hypothetical protein